MMKSCAAAACAAVKHPIEIWLRIAKGNISRNRFVKDVIFLKHHSDVPADIAIIESF